MWGIMIGKNGQDGYCGYGHSIADALRDLARELEVAILRNYHEPSSSK